MYIRTTLTLSLSLWDGVMNANRDERASIPNPSHVLMDLDKQRNRQLLRTDLQWFTWIFFWQLQKLPSVLRSMSGDNCQVLHV